MCMCRVTRCLVFPGTVPYFSSIFSVPTYNKITIPITIRYRLTCSKRRRNRRNDAEWHTKEAFSLSHAEKCITAAWRCSNGGGISKTGWELQNRAWLLPIDRRAHDTHAQFCNSPSSVLSSVTPQPDLTGQWHLFSYTQHHRPILSCDFRAPGRPHY